MGKSFEIENVRSLGLVWCACGGHGHGPHKQIGAVEIFFTKRLGLLSLGNAWGRGSSRYCGTNYSYTTANELRTELGLSACYFLIQGTMLCPVGCGSIFIVLRPDIA